jgi:tRNA pseudouridine38-40 synthase
LRQVPEEFSARYSAQSRTYRYTVLNQSVRSPLQERFALWVATPLNVGAMHLAANKLIGTRDFRPFGTPPHGENAVRRLVRSDVWREGAKILFEFEANAFLHRMARRLVGSLLEVGRGEIDLREFQEIVEHKRRARNSAPPNGLTLIEIKYNLNLES